MKEWFCFPKVTASFEFRTEVVFFQDWVGTNQVYGGKGLSWKDGQRATPPDQGRP